MERKNTAGRKAFSGNSLAGRTRKCYDDLNMISRFCFCAFQARTAARYAHPNGKRGVGRMKMVELIEKKRRGGALSDEEIRWMVSEYTAGRIPDYQMSAMLMAICFQSMNGEETLALTTAMMHSGKTVDLSGVPGVKADKHSTGGVGDKTSLVLCPIMAALGVKMAKMSGRGLGHTGGTVDKLESFPGFRADLSDTAFLEQVERVGIVISGQADGLCPADKKLYALRDVTGTVPAVPLIVSSIMSTKLAVGADVIVLDVKTGSGSFCDTEEDAVFLARELVRVGRAAGKKTCAIVTDMDEPLGFAVGNALEVREAIAALRGEPCGSLTELCLALGACILTESGLAQSEAQARGEMCRVIRSGEALDKLAQLVSAQGGDAAPVYDPSLLPQAEYVLEVPSPGDGYLSHLTADEIGRICMRLGGGRETKESTIDPAVGIRLHKKVGDAVKQGECLAEIHANDLEKGRAAAADYLRCCTFDARPPEKLPFIRCTVKQEEAHVCP